MPLLVAVLVPAAARAQEHDPAAHESPVPRLTLRGFSNIDLALNEKGRPNTFALGQFDLFVSSALSENWSFLAEVNFEFNDRNELGVDVERAQLRYAPSDAFSIAAGRMHTPLGYWNQTFHHGAWFQTTAGRPEMYLFEDQGGILPVHEVGLQAAGTLRARAVDFKYSVNLANGRGRVPDEVTNVQDHNGGKAVNAYLALAPGGVRGLEFGADVWLDTIPADPDTPGRQGEIRERILGGYVAYLRPDVEILAEASRVRHRDKARGATYGTWALYAQGSWKIGRWRPYYGSTRWRWRMAIPFSRPQTSRGTPRAFASTRCRGWASRASTT